MYDKLVSPITVRCVAIATVHRAAFVNGEAGGCATGSGSCFTFRKIAGTSAGN